MEDNKKNYDYSKDALIGGGISTALGTGLGAAEWKLSRDLKKGELSKQIKALQIYAHEKGVPVSELLKNQKRAAIGLTTAGIGLTSLGAYKHYKNKKEKK
jgi:hypothetical protein